MIRGLVCFERWVKIQSMKEMYSQAWRMQLCRMIIRIQDMEIAVDRVGCPPWRNAIFDGSIPRASSEKTLTKTLTTVNLVRTVGPRPYSRLGGRVVHSSEGLSAGPYLIGRSVWLLPPFFDKRDKGKKDC